MDGSSALLSPGSDGSTDIEFSDGTHANVDSNGNGSFFDGDGNKIANLIDNQIERLPKRAVSGAFAGTNYLIGKRLDAIEKAIDATTAQAARSQAVLRGVPAGDPAAEAAARQVEQSLSKVGGLDTAASKLSFATKIFSRGDVAALPLGVYFDIKDGVPPGQAIAAGTGGVVGGIAAAAGVAAGAAALGVAAPGIALTAVGIGAGFGAYYASKWAYGKLPEGFRDGVDGAARATGGAVAGGAKASWNAIKGLF